MEFFKSLGFRNKGGNVKEKEKEENDLTYKSFINMKKDNFYECVICLGEMKTGEDLTIIQCSHIYHSECIQKWNQKKRICPLCDYSF